MDLLIVALSALREIRDLRARATRAPSRSPSPPELPARASEPPLSLSPVGPAPTARPQDAGRGEPRRGDAQGRPRGDRGAARAEGGGAGRADGRGGRADAGPRGGGRGARPAASDARSGVTSPESADARGSTSTARTDLARTPTRASQSPSAAARDDSTAATPAPPRAAGEGVLDAHAETPEAHAQTPEAHAQAPEAHARAPEVARDATALADPSTRRAASAHDDPLTARDTVVTREPHAPITAYAPLDPRDATPSSQTAGTGPDGTAAARGPIPVPDATAATRLAQDGPVSTDAAAARGPESAAADGAPIEATSAARALGSAVAPAARGSLDGAGVDSPARPRGDRPAANEATAASAGSTGDEPRALPGGPTDRAPRDDGDLDRGPRAADRARGERRHVDDAPRAGALRRDRGPLRGPPEPPPPERAELPHASIDRDALDVVRRLRRAGHTAYLVGGCVRDLSLGLTPKDFDVATSARPEEIRGVFRNCRIIGRRFRLAHVFFRGGKIIETSTFRANTTATEADEDSDLLIRHDNVFGSEEEDALRRDFTINGLFYDPQSGRIIDHVGGLDDLRLRRVRMIGNPDIRLREDPVRILRAVRIAAKTRLSIDAELLSSMERHRTELAKCSAARLFEERMRLFRGGSGEKSLRLLEETGVLDSVFPMVAAYLARARASGATEDAELLFAHIAALDGIAQRTEVSDVVILAAVLHAPVTAAVAGRRSDEPLALVDELVARATELGATRKMTERLRQILLAQRHLERPAGKRRARRVPPEALMRRAYFAEALDLFEIVARATQHEESLVELAFWRDRGPVEPEATEGEAEEPTPHASTTPTQSGRRRRRRRGGRGDGRARTDATPSP